MYYIKLISLFLTDEIMIDDAESLQNLTRSSSRTSTNTEQKILIENSRQKARTQCYLGIGLICLATCASLTAFLLICNYQKAKGLLHIIYHAYPLTWNF